MRYWHRRTFSSGNKVGKSAGCEFLYVSAAVIGDRCPWGRSVAHHRFAGAPRAASVLPRRAFTNVTAATCSSRWKRSSRRAEHHSCRAQQRHVRSSNARQRDCHSSCAWQGPNSDAASVNAPAQAGRCPARLPPDYRLLALQLANQVHSASWRARDVGGRLRSCAALSADGGIEPGRRQQKSSWRAAALELKFGQSITDPCPAGTTRSAARRLAPVRRAQEMQR